MKKNKCSYSCIDCFAKSKKDSMRQLYIIYSSKGVTILFATSGLCSDSENLWLQTTTIASHFYRNTLVWSGKTLSGPASFASAVLSATAFDIANIFLTVFVKHVLCSSIEAWTNSWKWSLSSVTNEVLPEFFFLQEVDAGFTGAADGWEPSDCVPPDIMETAYNGQSSEPGGQILEFNISITIDSHKIATNSPILINKKFNL